MQTKKLPNTASKKDIVTMYHPMPKRLILAEINEIIYASRKDLVCNKNKTEKQIIKVQFPTPIEFKKIIQALGVPVGYEN